MRVLIAEDDKLFALDLQDMLESWGHEVLGPFDNVHNCMEAIEHIAIDLALLDVTLRDAESSAPVADALKARGIPIFVITGHTASHVESYSEFSGLPTLIKPINDEMFSGLVRAITRLRQDGDGMEEETV